MGRQWISTSMNGVGMYEKGFFEILQNPKLSKMSWELSPYPFKHWTIKISIELPLSFLFHRWESSNVWRMNMLEHGQLLEMMLLQGFLYSSCFVGRVPSSSVSKNVVSTRNFQKKTPGSKYITPTPKRSYI